MKNTPKIAVIGVGHCGEKLLSLLKSSKDFPVTYIAINTTSEMGTSVADEFLQISTNETAGFGAGGNPNIGLFAAQENTKQITKLIRKYDVVLLLAGMGHGTGTGAAPVIAQITRQHKTQTIALVTTPFSFEGASCAKTAQAGITELHKNVDTLLQISGDEYLQHTGKHISAEAAIELVDHIAVQMAQTVLNILVQPRKTGWHRRLFP